METIDKRVNSEEKINVKSVLKKGFCLGMIGIGAYLLSEGIACNVLGSEFNSEYINSLPSFYQNISKAFGVFGGLGVFYGLDK